MLGSTDSEIEGDSMVDDVIGEISNMVVGSTKTRICDKGFAVSLTVPTIIRGHNFKAHSGSSAACRRFSMKCGSDIVRVELVTKVKKKT